MATPGSFQVEEALPAAIISRHSDDESPDDDIAASRRMTQLSAGVLSLGLAGKTAKYSFKDVDEGSKITFTQAVMTMILNCVGSGILFFPKVMADVGILMAPILCLVCAAVCTECGTLIAKACFMGEQFLGVPITSYEELANFVGGGRMEMVVVVTKNFAMLGFIIVYFGLVADSIAQFFPQDPCIEGSIQVSDTTYLQIRFLIVYPVFAALAMLKNLKQLAQFAIVGIFAMVVECIALVGASLVIGSSERVPCAEGIREDTCNYYNVLPPQESFTDALGPNGRALSIFLFSYAILATIPSVRSQLKDPADLPLILRSSFGFCAILNIGIMSAGYYAFGGAAEDNQNESVKEYFPQVAQVVAVAIIVNLLLSTPLYSYCIISVFESTGKDACRTKLTVPNMIFRAGLVLALAVVNHFLPYAMEVIGLVSSVFACCNNILFPLAFFYMARKWLTKGESIDLVVHLETLGIPNFIMHAVVLFVGSVVFIFGTQGSFNTLMSKINADPVSTINATLCPGSTTFEAMGVEW